MTTGSTEFLFRPRLWNAPVAGYQFRLPQERTIAMLPRGEAPQKHYIALHSLGPMLLLNFEKSFVFQHRVNRWLSAKLRDFRLTTG